MPSSRVAVNVVIVAVIIKVIINLINIVIIIVIITVIIVIIILDEEISVVESSSLFEREYFQKWCCESSLLDGESVCPGRLQLDF